MGSSGQLQDLSPPPLILQLQADANNLTGGLQPLELGVGSQSVVLGDRETTDGCLIFNASVGSMPVVHVRPSSEMSCSLV